MKLRRQIKAIGGLATLLVFLGLVIADTVDAGVTLSFEDKVFLLTLIGSLLGVDKLLEKVPNLSVGVNSGGDDE